MTGLPSTARAFATYSLVPYLGIVFCPGAVVLGTVGLIRSYRSQEPGNESGRGVCYASTIVGLVVLAIQLMLWWILYRAPAWTNGL
jgi:preprotein translocase subunit Sec61beta